MKRPNILLLFSDQQRYDTIGLQNPLIRTPHLDRLAREGMLFERAYPPTPVCLPCRASLVTGLYPSSHRAMHNNCHLPQDHAPTLAGCLSQAGYYTHMVGKSHLNPVHVPQSVESMPFTTNRAYYRQWHGPWYGFQHADINVGHTIENIACQCHYGLWLEERGVRVEDYFVDTAKVKGSYISYGRWDLPEAHHQSKWVADVAIEAIERCADSEQPFFIWANFADPHNPCVVPDPWASMYAPEQMRGFGFKPGEPECFTQKPPFYREIMEQPGCFTARPSDPGLPGTEDACRLPWDDRQTRENAACYYGMISLMDHHIGRMLDALDRTGLAENTLVIFSSGHGDCLGDHGFWHKGILSFEEMLRVPLIVRFPGRVPAGATSRAFQNLVDLPATLLDYAGVPVPWSFEGCDQRPNWENPDRSVRIDTVIEDHPYSTDFNERILITHTHKLVCFANRDYGELYDLVKDPNQIVNLWDDAGSRPVRDRMLARVLSHEMNRRPPAPVKYLR